MLIMKEIRTGSAVEMGKCSGWLAEENPGREAMWRLAESGLAAEGPLAFQDLRQPQPSHRAATCELKRLLQPLRGLMHRLLTLAMWLHTSVTAHVDQGRA